MSENMTRKVRVRIEQGAEGYYFARSPDLKGLLVVEKMLEAMDKAIPQAISDLYAVLGQQVIVTILEDNTEDHDCDLRTWATTPVDVAENALRALRARTSAVQ